MPAESSYSARSPTTLLVGGHLHRATEKADLQAAIRPQVEVCFAALKRVFGMDGTPAKTLTGLATRITAKVTDYTYGCYANRIFGRPQGRIKELRA